MCTIDVKVLTAEKTIYNHVEIPCTLMNNSQENTKSPIVVLHLNGIQVHTLLQEIPRCGQCQRIFITFLTQAACWKLKQTSFSLLRLRIILKPIAQCPDTIDHNWNAKVSSMIRERSELDHALSWLSTLGGAFSALGDYFANCAVTAAKISAHQLQLALRMGEPSIAARCRLYFALSLIQRKHFRAARSIVWSEYQHAKTAIVVDERLLRMCQGIWAKLKYEWRLNDKNPKSM